ncbi:MAG TPA: potassium/proton antiporter [Acetobacteraceae bacterium]|nr:potassium/proton antiporter [Acetobacteraceae bacterium]
MSQHPLHDVLQSTYWLIVIGGALGVFSVLVGVTFRRIGAPVLLAFLGLGMLSGSDGVLGIRFTDFTAAYITGSVALTVILFQGGLRTPVALLRLAFWPALLLATAGVAVTTLVVGASVSFVERIPVLPALVAGAIAAPTDAGAVMVLLSRSQIAVPKRLLAVLEVESGLNDPMSVFLTFLLLRLLVAPGSVSTLHAVLSFAGEMAGGAILGLAAGWILSAVLRRLPIEPGLASVFVVAAAICIFGVAQLLETSGFLATYVAGIVTGARLSNQLAALTEFFEGLCWLAQIVLFLMLGLLITPHELPHFIPSAVAGTALLILLARPVAVFACLSPFGFGPREAALASWAGLRGAVPIYLSFIPALVDPGRDAGLFSVIFIVVVASLIVQGWTIKPAARLLGFAPGMQPDHGRGALAEPVRAPHPAPADRIEGDGDDR